MDRIFSAFVSSTFRDLEVERSAIANQLLRTKVFPLGMEYFPSTGGNQWSYIEEAITVADFVVLVMAGRYGTLDPMSGLSWTHREYRLARKLDKPIVFLLRKDIDDLAVRQVDIDSEQRTRLARFREEVSEDHECSYYSDIASLQLGLSSAIDELKAKKSIEGWSKVGPHATVFNDEMFDRVYQLTESHHRYTPSANHPGRMDLAFTGRRHVTSMTPQGLTHLVLDFTKSRDDATSFDLSRPVSISLTDWSREGAGSVKLEAPRKQTGTTFATDVKFDPPLRHRESADFTFEAHIPEYRFRYSEDLLAATHSEPDGARSFDFVSREISFPTREFVQSVSFASGLDVQPLGPRRGLRRRTDFTSATDAAETYELRERSEGLEMVQRIQDPKLFWTYRLAWSAPKNDDARKQDTSPPA